METKEISINARCTMFAHRVTMNTFAEHGIKFSDAFWRMMSGQGLISATDRKTIESLKKFQWLLHKEQPLTVRKVKRLVNRLSDPRIDYYKKWRSTVYEETQKLCLFIIQSQIERLRVGQRPEYLYKKFCFQKHVGCLENGLPDYKTTHILFDDMYSYFCDDEHSNGRAIAKEFASMSCGDLDTTILDYKKARLCSRNIKLDSRWIVRGKFEYKVSLSPTLFDDAKKEEKVRDLSKVVRSYFDYICDIPSITSPYTAVDLEDAMARYVETIKEINRIIYEVYFESQESCCVNKSSEDVARELVKKLGVPSKKLDEMPVLVKIPDGHVL